MKGWQERSEITLIHVKFCSLLTFSFSKFCKGYWKTRVSIKNVKDSLLIGQGMELKVALLCNFIYQCTVVDIHFNF